jgi:hypothetical protein
MADFWYTGAKLKLAKGDLDFDTADIRAKLCMTNTTADTDQDATNLTGITTIDEYDGSGYTEIDFAGAATAADNANDRAEIDYSDGSFGSAVGAGTRSWEGILIYCRVDGTAANDFPVAWIDLTNANGNGGAVNLTVNAEGLLQVT